MKSFGRLFSGLFVLFLAWCLASPPFAVSDETSHLAYAQAVARGQLDSPFLIPDTPIDQANCYASNSAIDVSCGTRAWTEEISLHTSPADSYPPFYYLLTGWAHYFGHGEERGYLVRVASAALSALVMATALTRVVRSVNERANAGLASIEPRVIVHWSVVVCTPAAAMYMGSVNPSGLAFASATAIALGISAIRYRPVAAIADIGFLSVMSSVFLLCRRDSVLWFALIVLLGGPLLLTPLLSTIRQTKAVLFYAIPPILCLVYQFSNAAGGLASSGITTSQVTSESADVAWWMTTQIPRYFQHMTTTLGWLDTTLPVGLDWITSLFYGGLAVGALIHSRQAMSLMIAAVGLFALVPILLISIINFGYYQGKYSMPLLPFMLMGPVVVGPTGRLSFDRAWASLQCVFASRIFFSSLVIHLIALWHFMRRNMFGLAGKWNIYSPAEWTPTLGVTLPLLMMIASYWILNRAPDTRHTLKACVPLA